MQRNTMVTILIVLILVLGGGAVWYLSQQNQTSTLEDTTESTNKQTETPSNPQSTDQDQSQSAGQQVIMKNSAFVPAKLTIKKGTTVTWTNEDTIKHNVVASDPSNTGGLPAANPLLEKGSTYSFTFNEVGSFNYLCMPHASFMKGTIEVTE